MNPKANKFASKKTASVNAIPATNNGFREIAEKSIKECLTVELKPLFDSLLHLSKKLQSTQEQLHNLHAIMMQDNNGQLIAKLDQLLNKTNSVKPAETGEQEKTDNNNKSPLEIMNKHFSGNIPDDAAFNRFFASADFTSPETLAESFADYNRKAEKLLCARRSNKEFLASAWQTHVDLNGNAKPAIKEVPATSPVKSLTTWSKELGTDKGTLQEFADFIKNQGFIADDDSSLLIDDCENIECSDELEDFMAWLKASLHVK